MLDFPSAPTIGQKYPQPAVGGVPVYTWDGEKWTTVSGSVGGKLPIWSDGSNPMTAQLSLVSPPLAPNDAASKAYVDARADIRVRHDTTQGLTTAQQLQARQNILAAPADLDTHGGMQFNGTFEVNLEFGTNGRNFSCAAANASTCDHYVADGWKMVANGGGTGASLINHTVGPITIGSITVPRIFQTYIDNHDFSVSGANDYCLFRHFIEGYRMRQLGFGYPGARPVTLGFWFVNLGSYSGQMGISLRNGDATRNITNYVDILPGDWRYYTTTFPGCPDGTWNTTNGKGFFLDFCLCGTPGLNAPVAGVWEATARFGAPNQANFMRLSTACKFCGVMVVAGSEAPPPYSTLINIRSYDEELAIAHRYFWQNINENTTAYPRCDSDTYRVAGRAFPVAMRASPTMTVYGILNYGGGQVLVPGPGAGYHWWEAGIDVGSMGNTFVIQVVTANARL